MGKPIQTSTPQESLTVIDNRTGKSYTIPWVIGYTRSLIGYLGFRAWTPDSFYTHSPPTLHHLELNIEHWILNMKQYWNWIIERNLV